MSVKKKPLVVVTRKLPDSIEIRMRELFDANGQLDDTPMTPDQIAEAVRSAEISGSTVTDHSARNCSAARTASSRMNRQFRQWRPTI